MKRLLIANRGEIACRIIRTARKMEIETVSVFSDADRISLHTKMADKSVYIGNAHPTQSYLKMDKIVDAALNSNCQAIHPGYGFLSENANFAEMCEGVGLIFVGPPANSIKKMGIKSTSKEIMDKAGVPIIPGYHGIENDNEMLFNEAKRIGFPVMIKAVLGGGGKGMRLCLNESSFIEQLESARSEALKSFGDSNMLIEKYIIQPRHIESQIFADNYGNCVYLSERDCSIQRRHQKVIEEAPAPGLDSIIQIKIGETAVKAAQAVGYTGAGTVEFIMDQNKNFYFMEMNTRLQVEHPVTEMITNLDLVEWQLRVARGEVLPIVDQNNIKINGHSIEARIYAEDTNNNFMPTPGKIGQLVPPEINKNIRIDSGIVQGDEISIYYDPMISKVIAKGENRNEAKLNLIDALQNYQIGGVTTNQDFLLSILQNSKFEPEYLQTDFIDKFVKNELKIDKNDISKETVDEISRVACAHHIHFLSQVNHSHAFLRVNHNITKSIYFKLNDDRVLCIDMEYQKPLINNSTFKLTSSVLNKNLDKNNVYKKFQFNGILHEIQDNKYMIELDNTSVLINYFGDVCKDGNIVCSTNKTGKKNYSLFVKDDYFGYSDTLLNKKSMKNIFSPLPGTIERIMVKKGEMVVKGQTLLVVTAMKMEHLLKATIDGKIENILFDIGEIVKNNELLIKME